MINTVILVCPHRSLKKFQRELRGFYCLMTCSDLHDPTLKFKEWRGLYSFLASIERKAELFVFFESLAVRSEFCRLAWGHLYVRAWFHVWSHGAGFETVCFGTLNYLFALKANSWFSKDQLNVLLLRILCVCRQATVSIMTLFGSYTCAQGK